MKKHTVLIFICAFCTIKINAQTYGRLGFKNDLNGGLYLVNINKSTDDLLSVTDNNFAKIKFYNANFRFGGSLIGSAIFNDDSKFFIGEYYQVGFGVGIGNKSGTYNSQYNGTTFNLMIGFNLGMVTSYSFNENLTVGLKVIGLGGDLYFDFDQNPIYANGLTFHPTAQFKNFYASVGFGGRNYKNNPYKTYEGELRYNFSKDQNESLYVGMRYQLNKFDKTELNTNSKQSISSIGIMFGKVF